MNIVLPKLKKEEPLEVKELTEIQILHNNVNVLYQELKELKSAIHFLQTLAVNKLSEQERYDLGIIEQHKADSQA